MHEIKLDERQSNQWKNFQIVSFLCSVVLLSLLAFWPVTLLTKCLQANYRDQIRFDWKNKLHHKSEFCGYLHGNNVIHQN